MPQSESTLQMAQRHVRQGADAIRRQREIIVRLRAGGFRTDTEDALLELLEDVQLQRVTHLEQLQRIAHLERMDWEYGF